MILWMYYLSPSEVTLKDMGKLDGNTLRRRQNGPHFAEDILNSIFLMKVFEFRFKFHWSLFLRVQWQYSIIGSDNGLAPSRRQATIWTNDGYITDTYMRRSASMS